MMEAQLRNRHLEAKRCILLYIQRENKLILRGQWSRHRAFLHPALALEGLILLKLHIHIYFRYTKTPVYIKTVQDIS